MVASRGLAMSPAAVPRSPCVTQSSQTATVRGHVSPTRSHKGQPVARDEEESFCPYERKALCRADWTTSVSGWRRSNGTGPPLFQSHRLHGQSLPGRKLCFPYLPHSGVAASCSCNHMRLDREMLPPRSAENAPDMEMQGRPLEVALA